MHPRRGGGKKKKKEKKEKKEKNCCHVCHSRYPSPSKCMVLSLVVVHLVLLVSDERSHYKRIALKLHLPKSQANVTFVVEDVGKLIIVSGQRIKFLPGNRTKGGKDTKSRGIKLDITSPASLRANVTESGAIVFFVGDVGNKRDIVDISNVNLNRTKLLHRRAQGIPLCQIDLPEALESQSLTRVTVLVHRCMRRCNQNRQHHV
jgi:hypothetical protein